MSKKKFKSPFGSKRTYTSKSSLFEYMEREHAAELGELSAAQYYFNVKNRYPPHQTHGKSVISGKPTEWNPTTERYERFANEKEKEEYRKQFVARMKRVHGKTHLLNDAEVQKKMLANRKISGTYKFADGGEVSYTGSYEKDLLEKLDQVFQWPSSDIHSPAPEHIVYKDPETKKERMYIPDFWIASLDLLIEVKSDDNQHYRKRDIHLEYAKDEAARKSGKHYVKVVEKRYTDFLETVIDIRDGYPNDGEL